MELWSNPNPRIRLRRFGVLHLEEALTRFPLRSNMGIAPRTERWLQDILVRSIDPEPLQGRLDLLLLQAYDRGSEIVARLHNRGALNDCVVQQPGLRAWGRNACLCVYKGMRTTEETPVASKVSRTPL